MCGTTRLEDALAAVSYGVDALGFIFYGKSPRSIDSAAAAKILAATSSLCRPDCGLCQCVDRLRWSALPAWDFLMCSCMAASQRSTAGKYGRSSPSHGIIKAFRVGEESHADDFSPYNDCVDAFLLDTYVKGAHGGTGKVLTGR